MRAQEQVASLLALHPGAIVLQYGAGCQPMANETSRLFLYCDNFSANTLTNPHSNIYQLTPAEQQTAVRLEAEVYSRAERIFTMSDFIRSQFIAQLGTAPSKLDTVHAGFSLDHAVEQHVEQPSDGFQILFVGRDWVAKGGPRLLKAFRLLRNENPAIRLDIVGPKALPPELSDEPGVTFHGFLDKAVPSELRQLQTLYRTSHVFALPTEYDSFGIAALEAMSYGLPVIITGTGALTEIVQGGVTGFCIAPDNDDELVDALRTTRANPDHARAMGMLGSERARGYFTWEGVARRMLAGMNA